MKFNALLKYALFEQETEIVNARLNLLRVSDDELPLLTSPVLWRVRVVLPRSDFELRPAELDFITKQPSTKGTWTVVCFVLASQDDWPVKERRLQQEQCVIELEALQRHLFHEEREEIGQFVNLRSFERRKYGSS